MCSLPFYLPQRNKFLHSFDRKSWGGWKEKMSHARCACTSFPELRIISVMVLVQLFSLLYFTEFVSIKELTKNFLLGTDGSLCMQ